MVVVVVFCLILGKERNQRSVWGGGRVFECVASQVLVDWHQLIDRRGSLSWGIQSEGSPPSEQQFDRERFPLIGACLINGAPNLYMIGLTRSKDLPKVLVEWSRLGNLHALRLGKIENHKGYSLKLGNGWSGSRRGFLSTIGPNAHNYHRFSNTPIYIIYFEKKNVPRQLNICSIPEKMAESDQFLLLYCNSG